MDHVRVLPIVAQVDHHPDHRTAPVLVGYRGDKVRLSVPLEDIHELITGQADEVAPDTDGGVHEHSVKGRDRKTKTTFE